MNENPPPLSPEHVDELLSAELDGEFDAAAVDLGFEPARAAELLDATYGVDARRHQLAAARDRLADVPPLDELTAARLRTGALDAALARDETEDDVSRARRRRTWTRVAGIAAALVAVLGIAAIANQTSSDNTKQVATANADSGANRSSGTTSPLLAVGAQDFGAAADANALGARVRETLKTAQTTTNSDLMPAAAGTVPSNVNGAYAFDSSHLKQEATIGAPCDSAARKSVDAFSAPVLAGTATLDQTPVTVFVYRRGSVYVLVASDAGCKVVVHRVLGP